MKTMVDWRIFFILLGSSLFSVFAIIPYILTVQGDLIKQIGIPLPTIFIAQLIQSAVLFSVAIFLA